MEIVQFDEMDPEKWNEFCKTSPTSWFRHTTHSIEYYTACLSSDRFKNCSFAVIENKQILAVVPLLVTPIPSAPEYLQLGLGQMAAPYPAFKNFEQNGLDSLTRKVFQIIDEIAHREKVAQAHFYFENLSNDLLNSTQIINPLQKFGYHDCSVYTNVVQLELPEEELLKSFSKGHRADVNAALKAGYVVELYNQHNYSPEVMETYRNLHRAAAGGDVGNLDRWNIWDKLLKDGFTVVALIKDQGKNEYMAGAIAMVYGDKALYGSGAINPNFGDLRGIGHLIQWELIKFLRLSNVKYYDLGTRFCPVIAKGVASKKQLNIGQFKSNFGGTSYPIFHGEKYYSKEYFRHRRAELTELFIDFYADTFR